nr:hypothetical protein [Tanacetum cinerariifolium]
MNTGCINRCSSLKSSLEILLIDDLVIRQCEWISLNCSTCEVLLILLNKRKIKQGKSALKEANLMTMEKPIKRRQQFPVMCRLIIWWIRMMTKSRSLSFRPWKQKQPPFQCNSLCFR